MALLGGFAGQGGAIDAAWKKGLANVSNAVLIGIRLSRIDLVRAIVHHIGDIVAINVLNAFSLSALEAAILILEGQVITGALLFHRSVCKRFNGKIAGSVHLYLVVIDSSARVGLNELLAVWGSE